MIFCRAFPADDAPLLPDGRGVLGTTSDGYLTATELVRGAIEQCNIWFFLLLFLLGIIIVSLIVFLTRHISKTFS